MDNWIRKRVRIWWDRHTMGRLLDVIFVSLSHLLMALFGFVAC